MFSITYKQIFGGVVTRSFPTRARAETWCCMIGRNELIRQIREVIDMPTVIPNSRVSILAIWAALTEADEQEN